SITVNIDPDINHATIDDVYGKATPETWTRFIHLASECWSEGSEYKEVNQFTRETKAKTRLQLIDEIVQQRSNDWLKINPKAKKVRKNVLEKIKTEAKEMVVEFICALFSKDAEDVSAEITESMKED
ncbi:MAG: hypothetical protein DWC00_05025, partial [Candidatus Poseidoniales archaeon]